MAPQTRPIRNAFHRNHQVEEGMPFPGGPPQEDSAIRHEHSVEQHIIGPSGAHAHCAPVVEVPTPTALVRSAVASLAAQFFEPLSVHKLLADAWSGAAA